MRLRVDIVAYFPIHPAQRGEIAALLRVQVNAGISIMQALRHVLDDRSADRAKASLQRLLDGLENGDTLTDSLPACPELFGEADAAILAVAEETGNLTLGLKLVEDHALWSAQIRRKTLSALIYPLAIINAAYLAFSVPVLLNGSLEAYLFGWFNLNLSIAMAAGALVLFARSTPTRRTLDRLLVDGPLRPLLGTAVGHYCHARFFRLLGAAWSAGASPWKCMELAARTLPNVMFKADLAACAERVHSGTSLSDAILPSRRLTQPQKAMLETGENAGAIPAIALKLAEEAQHKLDMWLHVYYKLLPLFLFLLVAASLVPSILKGAVSMVAR